MVFVGPVIAFIITKRICLGLQRADKEQVLHGYESGVIERSPDGGYSERHTPLSEVGQYELTTHERVEVAAPPPAADDRGVRVPGARKARRHAFVSKFYYGDVVDKPSRDDVDEARHHAGHDGHELEADEEFRGVGETGVPRSH
jgi:ubiquinol-cytochrome c reductase cytochrome b subunit